MLCQVTSALSRQVDDNIASVAGNSVAAYGIAAASAAAAARKPYLIGKAAASLYCVPRMRTSGFDRGHIVFN